jgi:hypothetical protein
VQGHEQHGLLRQRKPRFRLPDRVSRRITGISAQVAEWLMAADCKSAAPCELRRFESSPVHQKFVLNRIAIAFAVYAVLGILAWTTLQDSKIRVVTLLILALFAVKTLLRRKDVMHRGDDHDHEPM